MAELLTLARPYAKAAYGYASEQQATEQWSSALQMLSVALQDESFSTYINRPALTPKEKVNAFVQILGAERATLSVANFLTLLAENDRLALIPYISSEYELLKSQNNNTVDVVIESAFPLTPVQEQLLVSRLEKHFAKTVNATVEVNPKLIAGVIIHAGDQVIDDSAANKLEKMRTLLLA